MKPVWVLFHREEDLFGDVLETFWGGYQTRHEALAGVEGDPEWVCVKYVPAPTTKKRKAKRK